MTPDNTPSVPAEKITLEDLKHRAEAVKNIAVTDAKDAVAVALDTSEVKRLGMLIGAVALVAGIAYFMGTRAARRVIEVDTY